MGLLAGRGRRRGGDDSKHSSFSLSVFHFLFLIFTSLFCPFFLMITMIIIIIMVTMIIMIIIMIIIREEAEVMAGTVDLTVVLSVLLVNYK